MPLAENRIAELILRRLATEINPGECRELTNWATQSDNNQQQLKELLNLGNLRNKLRDFYNTMPGEPEEDRFLHAFHGPINSAPIDSGFLSAGL